MTRRMQVALALDAAEERYEEGDSEGALALCDEALAEEPHHAEAGWLAACCLRDLGRPADAEGRYRHVLRHHPAHVASWSGLGLLLFEALRFDEVGPCVSRAIRLNPGFAEAHYVRALVRERRGDLPGAARGFQAAHFRDPSRYPLPIPLDDATIEAVVEETVTEMHPSIQAYLAEVAILLEEVPDAELCRQWDPPMPPHEILGYFGGASLRERSSGDAWSSLPPTIVLFRRNLERVAFDRERMIEELRITVFHEIGHYLGLSEEDLEERGLD